MRARAVGIYRHLRPGDIVVMDGRAAHASAAGPDRRRGHSSRFYDFTPIETGLGRSRSARTVRLPGADPLAVFQRTVPLVQPGARRHGIAGVYGNVGTLKSATYRIQRVLSGSNPTLSDSHTSSVTTSVAYLAERALPPKPDKVSRTSQARSRSCRKPPRHR